MPRYQYKCEDCENTIMVIHRLDEIYEDCESCESTGSMNRLISSALIKTKSKNNQSHKIGDLTKKFIEANKDILKQQKKETKDKARESS